MALRFMDGFDHFGSGASPVTLGKYSASAGASVSIQTTVPRTGVASLRMTASGSYLSSKPFSVSGGAIIGAAYQNKSAFVATDLFNILEGASTVHVAVGITTGGLLTVKRGATVLATGTTVLALNNWYYLELQAVIHDTTGSYEVRIDGVTEAALTTAGPVDTRNGGTGAWDRILLGSGVSSGNAYWDDLYVGDTSGAAPHNTFLGPVKVETLVPQTDAVAAGTHAGLTPSTGTDHGALVDEVGPNTTDYNSHATIGTKDTYQYPALTLTGTIFGVQTNLYVAKSDAAVRQVCAVVRSGGTDYDGANVSPLTTFSYFSEVRAVNPATSAAWTAAEVAALEAGMKVTV